MKKKMRKQRRKFAVRIGIVLFAVWLVLSTVFSVVLINTTKNDLIKETLQDADELLSRAAAENYEYGIMAYFLDNERMRIEEDGTGMYYTYDNNIQIYALLKSENGTQHFDSDKMTFGNFSSMESETRYYHEGILNFDEIRASMTDEQYESISEYLKKDTDKDGNYYLLRCTEYYYDEEAYTLIPKTLEIVLTNDDHQWPAEDEVVEQYSLNPKGTTGLTLYSAPKDQYNSISSKFILGEFRSEGLVDKYLKYASSEIYEGGASIMELDPLNYVFAGAVYPTLTDSENEAFVGSLYYIKHIDILENCWQTLLFGVSVLFAFLLIIGIILTIALWKIMKTQMDEDHKRKEITNALAHDIKTPLFIIEGYAQSLKENLHTEKHGHYADRIIERTKEANDLVHKMLEFSQLDSPDLKLQLETVDIEELVKEVISDFDDLPDSNRIKLNIREKCTANADRELLHRALANLLDNALTYSDSSTNVNIDVKENSLRISNVCDNVTEDDIKHFTDPYFRAEKNRESKGNGLGLSIVKSITDLHGYALDINLNNHVITVTLIFKK